MYTGKFNRTIDEKIGEMTIYNFKNENSRIFMDSMFPADVFICPRDSGGYDGTESRG